MYVIFLSFAENRNRAGIFMEAHKVWIREGLDDRVFLLVGSLLPNAGGAVIAHGESREALEARVARDPFVAEGVVTAAIHEIALSQAAAPLRFLLAQEGAA